MLQGILIGLQILVLAGIGCMLWRLWRGLPKQEDTPMDEKNVRQLQHRLTVLGILAAVEAALAIASAVLRFVETLS